jgi:hypothetical protein
LDKEKTKLSDFEISKKDEIVNKVVGEFLSSVMELQHNHTLFNSIMPNTIIQICTTIIHSYIKFLTVDGEDITDVKIFIGFVDQIISHIEKCVKYRFIDGFDNKSKQN